MDRTPQSLRSSMSPYQHQGPHSAFSYQPSYPSPPHSESKATHQMAERGLGLYGCSLPSLSSQAVSCTLPPSPQPSELWSRPQLRNLNLPPPSSAPDVFSAAYDPFATVHSTPAHNYGEPTFPSAVLGTTDMRSPSLRPNGSVSSTQRSSFSSGATPEGYSNSSSELGYTPRVKMEESNDWFSNTSSNHTLQPTLPIPENMSLSQGSFPSTMDSREIRNADPNGWSRLDRATEDNRVTSGRSYDDLFSNYNDQRLKHEDLQSRPTNTTRTRRKRQLTTPADANHECRVCGKLFGRSYNFKAHMETHDPARVYNHPCTMGNCGKKFVRKTDLVRHQQSVHMRQRNYQCELCGNNFARKDTLRRHTEDGCPKRFEINSRGLRDSPVTIQIKTSAGIVPMRTRNLSISSSQSPPSPPQGAFSLPPLSQTTMFGRADYPVNQAGYSW
ncbi:MAG: hypothetical protein M1835_005013 [Candelina submexicana]|nr:MAG: hypothetical protein M1835_005013 [Candelina submexicana]